MFANHVTQRSPQPVRVSAMSAGAAKPSRRYVGGRTCETPGCATRLSVYNPRSHCWAHDEPRPFYPRVRPRVEEGPVMIELADLHQLVAAMGPAKHPEPPPEPPPQPFPGPGPGPVPSRGRRS